MEDVLPPVESGLPASGNPTASGGNVPSVAGTSSRRSRFRFLLPSLTDVLFVALLVVLFGAGKYGLASLLADGDCGWHIRTGEYILNTHSVPRVDLFSFTKAGQPWFAWEWLSDVIFALLYRALAFKGVVLLAALVCVTASVLVFLKALRQGGTLLVALALAQLATGTAAIHFLARPHVFTLLFLVLALWLVDVDRRRPTAWLWILIPLTVLWTNLHGGFLSMIACTGLVAAGAVVEAALQPDERRAKLRESVRYSILTVLCLAGSLVNPYGWELHRHTVAYLRSDWIKSTIQEFQAPHFRNESELQFELLLFLGVLCCGFLLRRRRVVEALWILFWGHESLTSIRHAPIFVFVCVPVIAVELSAHWRVLVAGVRKRSILGIVAKLEQDMAPAFRAPGIWFVIIAIALVVVNRPIPWPTNFPVQVFPLQAIERHREQLATTRVLSSDEWSDYLLFRNYPRQRVFFDGRSDFFGPAIGNDYLALYMARYDWTSLLEKYRVQSVFIPTDWPLATVLKTSRDWQLVDDDGRAIFFVRAGIGSGATAPPTQTAGASVAPPGGRLVP